MPAVINPRDGRLKSGRMKKADRIERAAWLQKLDAAIRVAEASRNDELLDIPAIVDRASKMMAGKV
jgi:predicted NUDIX family NTP pyrophosphohydrolase